MKYEPGQRVEIRSMYPAVGPAHDPQWYPGTYVEAGTNMAHFVRRDDRAFGDKCEYSDADTRPLDPGPSPRARVEIDVSPAPQVPLFLSADSADRKLMPVATGVMAYFPDALLLIAFVSRNGNEKHNPGRPLHWDKDKSKDEPDAEARHMLDDFRGLPPDPGLERLGKLGHKASKAWRALADLQRACDAERYLAATLAVELPCGADHDPNGNDR